MIDGTDIPEPIQWSEGMLLGPHHFQQATRRGEALLAYHLGWAAPFHWGVARLKIDTVRLTAGMLRVLELEAVMPDGLVVTHPADDGADLQVDLASFAPQLEAGPLRIYLAVASHRGGAALTSGHLARYRSVDGEEVADENTGDNALALPRLRPQLRLHVGAAPAQSFTSFPLAEVARRNEGLELTDFAAPLLVVMTQSMLAEQCRDLRQRVRAKAAFIAERLHSPEAELREATMIELRHSLQCLIAELPGFEAVLDSAAAHPFAVYAALARLAGNLAALGAGVVPPLFDPYNHNEIARSFAPVLSFANRMLDSVSETHVPVAFVYEAGSFRLMIEPAWLRSDLLIGVRARPRQSEREIIAWIEEAVIASSERVSALAATRIRGAARRQLTAEEDIEFLPARGTYIFRIAADPNFILPRRVLEIINPADRAGDRRPVDIVLHVPAEPAAERTAPAPDAGRPPGTP